MIRQLLWIGPLFNADVLGKRNVLNQAAAKWSWAILNAFSQLGVQVEGIAHCPEQVWPFGKRLWVGSKGWAIGKYPVHGIGYLNLPWIRKHFLASSYRRKTKQVLQRDTSSVQLGVPFDAILGYNVIQPYEVAVVEVAKRLRIPYFGIILDGNDPRRDNWKWILENTKDATGLIFLSHWMNQNYPGTLPTFHFDGGGGEWRGDKAIQMRESNLIVYTGALDHWRGGDFLVEIVRQLKRQDVRIVLCGKCNRVKTWARFGNDSRVEVKGFVSEAEMDDLCCRASAFLNVRDPLIGDNVVNFPSKIPNYLAYGKPIVSMWLPSLSPEYRGVLEVVEQKDAFAFAQKIEMVLDWPNSEFQRKHGQIKKWYCSKKTWQIQVKSLLEWMNNICQ